jgi:hypothetical protein
VASDSAGNFVVVWGSYYQDGSGFGVFGQRYASTGALLGPAFRVNTYTTMGQRHPAVASDSSGNFVVVWQSSSQDGSSYGVFGRRYASSGAPLGPEFRVNTFTTNSQSQPAVASDSSGNFVVVWTSDFQDGASGGVFGQVFARSGAPVGPEFQLNAYTTNSQGYPAVAADASGNFVVVWTSYFQDGSSSGVFGQLCCSSTGDLGLEFRVNTFTPDFQGFPAVASDSSGNFVVTWESNNQDGSSSGIFGRRYDRTGAALGPEFRVNTYTTDLQRFPAVASDSSGKFVVAWMSYRGGSNYDIFGQRYSAIAPVERTPFEAE